ncbi:MAG: serine/threonine protein kinase [Myxococcales bacterium]|nr:serine/threonine protein kinase [Myxococcales bacterium]
MARVTRVREPTKFGDYYLFDRVAVGGMAEVFKAVSYGVEGFERLFAVKRVLPNIAEDQEFVEMFIDEAKIAVQLTHANIGQIFELGKVDGSYFIAMEFVQGKDVRALFDRARTERRSLDVAMCCHVIKEVCEALEYAHNKKRNADETLDLVHRDVSPQNIIVSYDGEVKLIDFGIAKAAGKASKTQAGILKGKFGYMSPEQVRGRSIDHRTDLFSLAAVLYELVTLERCFQGESDFSTLEKVRSVDIRRPSAIARDIPPELERIILRGLAREPEDRYQSAAEFQDALQKFLYQSGTFYARKDLAAYMRRTFDAELRTEQSRLAQFREFARHNIPEARRASSGPVDDPEATADEPGSFKPDLPTLSWEDEEVETAIWDRSPSQVMAAVDVPKTRRPVRSASDDPPAFAHAAAQLAARSGAMASSQPLPEAHAPTPPPLASPPPRGPHRGPEALVQTASIAAIRPGPAPATPSGRWRLWTLGVVAILAIGVAAFVVWRERQGATVVFETDPPQLLLAVDDRAPVPVQSPVNLADLPAGPHRLRFTAEGYQPAEQRLSVNPGQRLELARVALARIPTGLHIETVPGGAKVFIDGAYIDESPVQASSVAPGNRTLRIEKAGFLPWEGTVKAAAGTLQRVEPIKLMPARVTVSLMPDPIEAEVAVVSPDGSRRVVGKGNQRVQIDNVGGTRVEVRLDGFEPLVQRLPQYPQLDGNTQLLTLKKDESAARRAPPPPEPPVAVTPRRPRRDTPPATEPPRRPAEPDPEDAPPTRVVIRRPPARPATEAPPPPKPEGKGFLKLIAKPPAQAFILGRSVGWTPLIKHELPAGTHTIELVREGEGAYRRQITVVIEADKTTLRKFSL